MKSTSSIPSTQSTTYGEISANGALALITVATSLLTRQITSLEKAFVEVPRIPLFQPYLNVALQKDISG